MTGIDSSIANLKRRKKDLDNYSFIMNSYRFINVSCDEEFKRKFTYFYRVRRNSTWRRFYFQILEDNKDNHSVTFEFILRSIYQHTGRIEASFASKMLATIKPEMPIWDSIILLKLGLKPSTCKDKEKRLQETVNIYNNIVVWYDDFILSLEALRFIEAFDCTFPEFRNFSRIKKIDFLIWGSGDSNPFL